MELARPDRVSDLRAPSRWRDPAAVRDFRRPLSGSVSSLNYNRVSPRLTHATLAPCLGEMARYQLEIFEPLADAPPAIRHRIIIMADSDDTAIAQAISWYRDLAGFTKLAGFVLYDGLKVVFERRH